MKFCSAWESDGVESGSSVKMLFPSFVFPLASSMLRFCFLSWNYTSLSVSLHSCYDLRFHYFLILRLEFFSFPYASFFLLHLIFTHIIFFSFLSFFPQSTEVKRNTQTVLWRNWRKNAHGHPQAHDGKQLWVDEIKGSARRLALKLKFDAKKKVLGVTFLRTPERSCRWALMFVSRLTLFNLLLYLHMESYFRIWRPVSGLFVSLKFQFSITVNSTSGLCSLIHIICILLSRMRFYLFFFFSTCSYFHPSIKAAWVLSTSKYFI